MKKAIVQFDGANFYHRVKRIFPTVHLSTYDYLGLSRFITKDTQTNITYYVGEIRKYKNDKKSEILYAGQQSLFLRLRKQGIKIKLGYLLMAGGSYHEKGVDVQIAVDIVRGAIKNEYNIYYLISSDTDLLPAIQTAKEEGKKVVYIGFENYISRALLKNCSKYLILTRKEIERFV